MGQPNNPLPQHYDGAIPTFGRCTKHGKVRFKSRSDAKKVARKNHNQNANRPGRLNRGDWCDGSRRCNRCNGAGRCDGSDRASRSDGPGRPGGTPG